MLIEVRASHQKGNAPPGYLVVRVEFVPGVFVESERNPYTGNRFRWFCVFVGEAWGSHCLYVLDLFNMSGHSRLGARGQEALMMILHASEWFDETMD